MALELERAARGTEAEPTRVLGSCFWAAGALMAVRGAAARRAPRSGGARRAEIRSRAWGLGAPRGHRTTKRKRNKACWRTNAILPTTGRRQLQALVRPHAIPRRN